MPGSRSFGGLVSMCHIFDSREIKKGNNECVRQLSRKKVRIRGETEQEGQVRKRRKWEQRGDGGYAV